MSRPFAVTYELNNGSEVVDSYHYDRTAGPVLIRALDKAITRAEAICAEPHIVSVSVYVVTSKWAVNGVCLADGCTSRPRWKRDIRRSDVHFGSALGAWFNSLDSSWF